MNKDLDHIRTLLQLYYNGESTLEQEAELKEFFAGPDVPPEMEADATLMQALSRETEVPEAARRSVDAAMGKIVGAEMRRRRLGARIAAVAAGVAVLAAVGISVFRPAPPRPELTPEETRQQVEMAFSMLTSTVKKGCESINSI